MSKGELKSNRSFRSDKQSKEFVKLNDHLTAPTLSNLESVKALKDKPSNVNDIWWERRFSKKKAAVENAPQIFDTVNSKYQEETTAFASQKTKKFESSKDKNSNNFSLVKMIDPDSHVLQPTLSVLQSAWNVFISPGSSENQLDIVTSSLAPKNVESKLYEPTAATEAAKWKAKISENSSSCASEDSRSRYLKRVSAVSERLTQSTAAVERGRYRERRSRSATPDSRKSWRPASVNPSVRRSSMSSSSDRSYGSSSQSTSRKVRETSPRLLIPTENMKNSRWESEPKPSRSFKDIHAEIKISDHLLVPTAAMINGTYKKPDVEPDPRELGWQPHFVKQTAPIVDTAEMPQQSTMKVSAPSERLLNPTTAVTLAVWRGPPEPDIRSVYFLPSHETKKLNNITPVRENAHFLEPTEAFKHGMVNNNSEQESTSNEKTGLLLVRQPSVRLLTPTLNNRIDFWKAYPKAVDPKPVTGVISIAKKSDYYCKCYACSKMQEYNWKVSIPPATFSQSRLPSSVGSANVNTNETFTGPKNISELVLLLNDHMVSNSSISPAISTRKDFTVHSDIDHRFQGSSIASDIESYMIDASSVSDKLSDELIGFTSLVNTDDSMVLVDKVEMPDLMVDSDERLNCKTVDSTTNDETLVEFSSQDIAEESLTHHQDESLPSLTDTLSAQSAENDSAPVFDENTSDALIDNFPGESIESPLPLEENVMNELTVDFLTSSDKLVDDTLAVPVDDAQSVEEHIVQESIDTKETFDNEENHFVETDLNQTVSAEDYDTKSTLLLEPVDFENTDVSMEPTELSVELLSDSVDNNDIATQETAESSIEAFLFANDAINTSLDVGESEEMTVKAEAFTEMNDFNDIATADDVVVKEASFEETDDINESVLTSLESTSSTSSISDDGNSTFVNETPVRDYQKSVKFVIPTDEVEVPIEHIGMSPRQVHSEMHVFNNSSVNELSSNRFFTGESESLENIHSKPNHLFYDIVTDTLDGMSSVETTPSKLSSSSYDDSRIGFQGNIWPKNKAYDLALLSWTKKGSTFSKSFVDSDTPLVVRFASTRQTREMEDIHKPSSTLLNKTSKFYSYDDSAKSPMWLRKNLKKIPSFGDTDDEVSTEYDDSSQTLETSDSESLNSSPGQSTKERNYATPAYLSWTKRGSARYSRTENDFDNQVSPSISTQFKRSKSKVIDPSDTNRTPEWSRKSLRHVEFNRDSDFQSNSYRELRHVEIATKESTTSSDVPWKIALKRTNSRRSSAMYYPNGAYSSIPSTSVTNPPRSQAVPRFLNGRPVIDDTSKKSSDAIPWKVSLKSVASTRGSNLQTDTPKEEIKLQHVSAEERTSTNSLIIIPETKSVKDLVKRFQKS